MGTVQQSLDIAKYAHASVPYKVELIKPCPSKINVNIALISHCIPSFDKVVKDDYEILKIPAKSIKNHKNIFLKSIREACSKADIVCLSEMSYPDRYKEVKEELIRLSKTTKTYIIAGSYHDDKTICNTSYIFTPHTEPYTIHKLRPAHEKGEKIKSPSSPKIVNFATEYGNFCVVICYDSFGLDVGATLQHYQTKFKYQSIDFLFVPSYNDSPGQGRDRCKNYSEVLRLCTLYVNDLHPGDCSEASLIRPLPEGPSTKRGGKYTTRYYVVNLKKIRDERKNLTAIKKVT